MRDMTLPKTKELGRFCAVLLACAALAWTPLRAIAQDDTPNEATGGEATDSEATDSEATDSEATDSEATDNEASADDGPDEEKETTLEPVLTDSGTVHIRYKLLPGDIADPFSDDVRATDNMVAAINEVKRRMDGLKPGQRDLELEKMLTATCDIDLWVYLQEGIGKQPWVLTLKVGTPKVNIPQFAEPDLKRALYREVRALSAALGDWSRELTYSQVLWLKRAGEIPMKLKKPFEVLFLWSRPKVTLKLHRTLKPEITSIRYFIVGPHGLRPTDTVPTTVPIVAEVTFSRPPERPAQLVRIRAAGSKVLKLVAQRVDNNPLRFMTPQFVVWNHDDGLPPEPEGVVVEGEER